MGFERYKCKKERREFEGKKRKERVWQKKELFLNATSKTLTMSGAIGNDQKLGEEIINMLSRISFNSCQQYVFFFSHFLK